MVEGKKKLLVTTALENTWGGEEDIVFLGEWCKRYERRHVWRRRQHQTMGFHWDDRAKLKRDYDYLKPLHDSLLKSLASSLNDLHHASHSLRYWQFQVDPWLMSFVGVVYDRWECLRAAFDEHSELSTIVSEDQPLVRPPIGYVEQQDLMRFSDVWNHALYLRIIKSQYPERCRLQSSQEPWRGTTDKEPAPPRQSSWRWRLASKLDRLVGLCGIGSKVDFVFLESYFRAPSLVRLNFALGQAPRLFLSEFGFDEVSSGAPMSNEALPNRGGLTLGFRPSSPFEAFLVRAIVDHAPTALIEAYPALCDWAGKLRLRPKVIFTANAHWTRVHVKTWLAGQMERGVKVVVVEHGGSLPAYKELFGIEEEMADVKVTWFRPYHAKHVQLPPSKFVRVFKRNAVRRIDSSSTRKHCLFIGCEEARYVFRVQFYPLAAQCLVGFDLCARFHQALNSKVRQAFRVKAQVNYGWNTRQRYSDMLGEAHVLPPMTINRAIEMARVVVCGYPETTFADAMVSGVPTIMLYPDELYERHPVTRPLLALLRTVKIVLHDPAEAAAHLNAIWGDPGEWWNSEDVRHARAEFERQAIRLDGDWVKQWKSFACGLVG